MVSFGAAVLIGAALGLERAVRGAQPGSFALAMAGALGWLVAFDLGGPHVGKTTLVFALACGGASVALAAYVSEPARAPNDPLDRGLALASALGFGALLGFGAAKAIGVFGLIALFGLAWRALAVKPASDDSTRAPVTVLIRGRAEERGHDDERRQQREGERQGEQFAHAGRAGMAGQP